jgi:cytochrome oxidase assembly protein ShyY1
MIRFALRPRWWAWHAALVAVLVSFGWLGWWQLQSFEGSGGQGKAAGPRTVALDRVTSPGDRLDAGDVGRRVRATGTWETAGQLVVPDRELDGRPGDLVVTPLRTAGGVLPVVRGWVSRDSAVLPPPSGRVVVTGAVQPSETEADAAAGSAALPEGQIAYVATVTLLERLPYGAAELYDGYVVLRSQQPPDPGAPERVEPRDEASPGGVGRWRNLAYGLQWWLFAGAAVFFWAAVLRRAAQERTATPPPDRAREPLAAPRRTT